MESKAPKPPSRAQCAEIVKRFLKPDQNITWAREMPTFYRLWKQYPSLDFWTHYELPFGNNSLNMMSWFESVEGKEELPRAWLLFNYNPPVEKVQEIQLDTTVQPVYTVPITRPKTVAEFLKTN